MNVKEKLKALVNAYTELAECTGCSERSTMEALLGILDPEEMVELGFTERVKAYFDEYGAEGEWEQICRNDQKKGGDSVCVEEASVTTDYGTLKPLTLVDAILEAIKRGYTYMDGRRIKDFLLDELRLNNKPDEKPSHILVNAFIVDLSDAWDDNGNIYFLDT